MLFALLSSMMMAARPNPNQRIPQTINKWSKGENINWMRLGANNIGTKTNDWREKFGALEEKIDVEVADELWDMLYAAKTVFHQDNLWIMTSSNDSLVAAMIDVEWAFDAVFMMYFIPMPGSRSLRGVQKKGLDIPMLNQVYNKTVGEKIKALLQVGGLRFDPGSEPVRFANAIKQWYNYNTVRWNDSDSLVEECPKKFLKSMGRNHKLADVKTEWCRVQNSISDFHNATKWIRDKGNTKMNKALDDFEGSLLDCFRKYVKEIYSVELNKMVYSEVMPLAVDVLCMEYVSAVEKKDEDKK